MFASMVILELIILVYFFIWFFQLLACVLLRLKHESTEKKDTNLASNEEKVNFNSSRFKQLLISFLNGLEKWTIYRVGKIPSHIIRKYIYTCIFGLTAQKRVVIYAGSIFRRPSRIKIGQGSIIGDRCELDGRGGLTIGKFCNLSSEVHIWTAQHDPQASRFDYTRKPVEIGNRCWISSNTVILPGVKLGEGTVLAAGAVLTHDTEPFSIYAGVPARKIGDRNNQLKYEFDGSHDWFV